MKNNTSSDCYIIQNAPTVTENCFKHFLWGGKPFSETIQKSFDHSKIYPDVDSYLFRAAINSNIISALESLEAFKKFLESRRVLCIFPAYRSVNKFITGEFETDKTLEQLYYFLKNAQQF